MKKYSVLMSVYSKANPHFLKDAIDSMFNQTIMPNEFVVVEDGKLTSKLLQVLDSYGNKIKRVHLKDNVGLGLALNEGLQEVTNELVARMDADDVSVQDRCEKELLCFEKNTKLDIVGSWIDEYDFNLERTISTRKVPEKKEDIYNFGKRRSAFNHPVVMFKKSSVLEVGGYSNLRRNQDIDLFGRMMFSGCDAYNIQESLLLFRVDNELLIRRKSWENTKLYIKTIYKFWKIGYSSFFDLIFVAGAQLVLFVTPSSIQQLLYKIFLRK